jgi:hypothetical protein
MAELVASEITNLTTLMVPPVLDDCTDLHGLATIDVNASMPEFGISAGDKMLVNFDAQTVRTDGLYLVEENGWTGVRRFQRIPQPITPLGLRIKLDSDTRWADVTQDMLDGMTVLGCVMRLYRAEIIG